MPRSSVRSTQITGSSRKIAAARAAVNRSVGVLRARNARLRRRNVRTAGFLGIETKFVDTLVSNTNVVSATDATGGELDPTTVNCLNAVAQGDGEQQRDGKNYMIKGLYIRGQVKMPSAANLTGGQDNYPIFLAVVHDTQTNAAQLNSEDVFKNIIGTGAGGASCMRNLLYSKRFNVLWSKVVRCPVPWAAWDGTNIEKGGTAVNFSCNLPNLNIRVECKGTSANVTDIVDHSLHFIGFSAGADGTPKIDYASRVRFVG